MAVATTASLWAGVVLMGIFHGLNPAMGWPLAVANGLGEKRDAAVFSTWVPLGAGHLAFKGTQTIEDGPLPLHQ